MLQFPHFSLSPSTILSQLPPPKNWPRRAKSRDYTNITGGVATNNGSNTRNSEFDPLFLSQQTADVHHRQQQYAQHQHHPRAALARL